MLRRTASASRQPRDFSLFLYGQATSVFGTTLTSTAIAIIAVVTLHQQATGVSHIVAAGLLPALLLGPFCGVVLDRVRRPRRLLIGADLTAAVAVGGSFFAAASGRLSVALLAVLAFTLGLVQVVVGALYFSHLRSLGLPDLAGARGRLQSTEMGTKSVAGVLAGAAVATLGAATLFLADALTYLVSASCLLALRSPDHRPEVPADGPGYGQQLREGIAVVRQHRTLSAFMAFLLISSAAASGVVALRAVYLIDVLHLPLAYFTLPSVVASLFGAAGALAAPGILRRIQARRLLVGTMLLSAVSAGLIVFAGGPLPVELTVLVLGTAVPLLFGSIGNLALVSVLSDDIGDAFFGRVTTLLGSVATAASLLGSVSAGVLGSWLDVRIAVAVFAALNITGALVLATATRTRRTTGHPAPDDPGTHGTDKAEDAQSEARSELVLAGGGA